jgi:hypothetical protein
VVSLTAPSRRRSPIDSTSVKTISSIELAVLPWRVDSSRTSVAAACVPPVWPDAPRQQSERLTHEVAQFRLS